MAGLDPAANKVFITGWGDMGTSGSGAAFPFVVKKGGTKIVDGYGATKNFLDLKPGANVKVEYAPSQSGAGFVAQRIILYQTGP